MAEHDFLLEIGTEELPPKALETLCSALVQGLTQVLQDHALDHGAIDGFATPRRLAVRIARLSERQPPRTISRRGPALAAAFDAEGRPTQAARKFAESCGVALEQLGRLQTDKGTWLHFEQAQPGRPTVELLPELIPDVVMRLPVPRAMRWGAGEVSFVRPVHWIVMLYGEAVVPGRLFDISADRYSRGHRFHHPEPVMLTAAADYPAVLEAARVLVDPELRKARIQTQIEVAAAQQGGRAVIDESLLAEVTALVEWPVAMVAAFDARYLELPEELLIATLQNHQRYFPLRGADGALLRHFIIISNIESKDPAQVRAGNERVVRPRLADAEFFYRQDLQHPLTEFASRLTDVIFQDRLGSLADKTQRITALTAMIAQRLGEDIDAARRAAALAKADLLSGLVGEFPELQGIMGNYYAQAQGEPQAVAQAIREHYLPRQAGDALPQTPLGRILALADRLDTLCGVFAIGARPSGDKDPFALRRAAIGVVRILIDPTQAAANEQLDLAELLKLAVELQPVQAPAGLEQAVLEFILDRLRAYYLEGGIRHDVINAVMAIPVRSLIDFDRRLRAVQDFLQEPAWETLAAANKRIQNILRKQPEVLGEVDSTQLEVPQEIQLHEALRHLAPQIDQAIEQWDYQAALTHLARLKKPIDDFFDHVLVMADDDRLRRNRLALLRDVQNAFLKVADISCLQAT